MCLSSRKTRKAQREAVAKLPEWITVWKVFYGSNYRSIRHSSNWESEMFTGHYTAGTHVAREIWVPIYTGTGRQRYKTGFHCFATRKGAVRWMGSNEKKRIVPCRIKAEWITSIGIRQGNTCYVTKKIKIPSPKQYFKTHK